MHKIITWAVFLIFAGFAGAGHAAPPAASSLKEIWQGLDGNCGNLVAKDGGYELSFDKTNSQSGKYCVVSVGADVVVFGPNEKGALIEAPRQYLVVPMERIVLQIRQ